MEPFQRVLWLVIDGLGYEEARRCVEARPESALARLAREGYLGPSHPSRPVCQTPSALLALFAGSQPMESKVWGYHMPDPTRPRRSMLGFYAPVQGLRTIWSELEERGLGYSLMNVAFRNDPLWSLRESRLRFGYDGYRTWKKPRVFPLSGRRQRIVLEGIEVQLLPGRSGVALVKGGTTRAVVPWDGSLGIRVTRGLSVRAYAIGTRALLVCPLTTPTVHGAAPPAGARAGFQDGDAFRFVRRWREGDPEAEEIPVAAEMSPTVASFGQKAALMAAAAADPLARLVIGYFPNIDELNHSYADLIESEWPHGRGARLLLDCAGLVDELLQRLMDRADQDTLLVVSSDHGVVPHRRELHLNELFADVGLVRRCRGGYDPARSVAYYHPSDCGQVVLGGIREGPPLPAIRRALDRAAADFSAPIALLEAGPQDPYLAFLYPLSDVHLTGRPPASGKPVIQRKVGGDHLSPLAPTPWIQAILGLWSARGRLEGGGSPPTDNARVKDFILGALAPGRS